MRRCQTDSLRRRVVESLEGYITKLTRQHGISSQVELKHDADAVLCDKRMSADLARAAQQAHQVLTCYRKCICAMHPSLDPEPCLLEQHWHGSSSGAHSRQVRCCPAL